MSQPRRTPSGPADAAQRAGAPRREDAGEDEGHDRGEDEGQDVLLLVPAHGEHQDDDATGGDAGAERELDADGVETEPLHDRGRRGLRRAAGLRLALLVREAGQGLLEPAEQCHHAPQDGCQGARRGLGVRHPFALEARQ